MDFSNTIRSKLLPALAAFALFFVVSAAYFAPQFRGEALPQHDVIQYEGMAKDISDMRAATGEDPQWTGGMFGGMPAYLINVAYPAQLVKRTVGQVVKIIDTPAGFLFFAMVSMWLMLLIVGINPWVGIVAALAYGLSTYFLLIIGAGHVTKMWALVYAPLMMSGAWMTLRGNVWCGAALTGLAASLGVEPTVLYFGLLSGATLGGNCTPIGASANIAGIGILRKNGETVRTADFLRIGVPFTLAAVLTGSVYLWLVWGRAL